MPLAVCRQQYFQLLSASGALAKLVTIAISVSRPEVAMDAIDEQIQQHGRDGLGVASSLDS